MLSQILQNKNLIISTGNVINVNDLRKKAGQKPTDELIDSLKSTIIDCEFLDNEVIRKNNDLNEKIQEHQRGDIKIGAKIFLNNYSDDFLKESIDKLFKILNIDFLDNLILSFHPKSVQQTEQQQNGDIVTTNGGEMTKEGTIEWGKGNDKAVINLKKLWSTLEEYANVTNCDNCNCETAGSGRQKKIGQLGIADLDVDSLKNLYENSKIHPTIVQINLAACCVVPPELQTFCSQNDIQLLTHSDPQEILTKDVLNDIEIHNFHPLWTTRYQVHVKCRGVLAAKGFIVSIEKD
uniref:GCS light chain n=1 Tax=Corethrella appendiculata TaxID=1370023 RepID=U5EYT2_9DIPT